LPNERRAAYCASTSDMPSADALLGFQLEVRLDLALQLGDKPAQR